MKEDRRNNKKFEPTKVQVFKLMYYVQRTIEQTEEGGDSFAHDWAFCTLVEINKDVFYVCDRRYADDVDYKNEFLIMGVRPDGSAYNLVDIFPDEKERREFYSNLHKEDISNWKLGI